MELPNGRIIDNYFVRETRGFAVVAAITPERDIVLVRQYKHGIGRIVVELPAGMIESDEAPLDCAVRELAEETGYTGTRPQVLRTLFADPTSSNGTFHVCLVEDARITVAPALDETEEIVVETVSVDAFARMLRDGTIASGSQVAAGYVVLDALT